MLEASIAVGNHIQKTVKKKGRISVADAITWVLDRYPVSRAEARKDVRDSLPDGYTMSEAWISLEGATVGEGEGRVQLKSSGSMTRLVPVPAGSLAYVAERLDVLPPEIGAQVEGDAIRLDGMSACELNNARRKVLALIRAHRPTVQRHQRAVKNENRAALKAQKDAEKKALREERARAALARKAEKAARVKAPKGARAPTP